MPNTVLSPVMSMPVPVPGADPGPQYAFDLNSCLNILDQHDHTVGRGNPITPSAMLINADLLMGSNNIINLRSARFNAQVSPLALAADIGCAYVSGVDLWYNDVSGNQIQITALGGVAGTPGSIANLVSPASASYVAGSKTFVWQSNVNQAANMDAGSYILRNIPGTFGLTLSPPALGSNYTVTLPTLPGTPSFVSIDSSGNMGDAIPLSQGIDTANITNSAITTPLIADANVTLAKMAANSVDTPQIVDGSVTHAKLSSLPYTNTVSSGTFPTSSTSPVDVPNLTLNFTATGRPLYIGIYSDNASSPGCFQLDGATNPASAIISINRSGTGDIQSSSFGNNLIGSQMFIPANLTFIDIPAAGSYTYKIRVSVNSATTTLSVKNLRLVMYEL